MLNTCAQCVFLFSRTAEVTPQEINVSSASLVMKEMRHEVTADHAVTLNASVTPEAAPGLTVVPMAAVFAR